MSPKIVFFDSHSCKCISKTSLAYTSGSQTFLCAGAGNWLNKFRGTPASDDLQKKRSSPFSLSPVIPLAGFHFTARMVMTFFFLEITTCLGENLWNSLDAAPNDASHQKEVIISLAVICNATRDLQQLLTITSWQHFLDFGRKFVST